jgi:hypothetical protein
MRRAKRGDAARGSLGANQRCMQHMVRKKIGSCDLHVLYMRVGLHAAFFSKKKALEVCFCFG